MVQERIHLAVSPEEYRIITTLRDMPESPLRERVQRLLDEVLEFARNPRCFEYQADGVPCADPEADCDQCQVVLAMLDRLEQRLPRCRQPADPA
jgi:hypothetical protein